jgi:2-iminobutanoate/2-iminopropanoate deaminase
MSETSGITGVSTEKAFPPAAAYVSPRLHLNSALLITPFQSQAVIAPANSKVIYVSGQIPGIPPSTINRGSISEQATHSFANIKSILEAAGSGLDKIVKVTVFLSILSPTAPEGESAQDTFNRKYTAMNEVYAKQFPKEAGPQPARSCVGVAVLPAGVDVEIECVAIV